MEEKQEKELTRAFVCIDFENEVVKEIARVQEQVGKIKFTGKFTELPNLHLTLKFLGEIESEKLGKIREKLREIKFNEIELKLGNVGVFSSNGKPRIVWVKVEGKEIWELQKKIDLALREILQQEERFMSHVTIARVKYVKDKEGFKEYCSKIGVKEIKFKVLNFKLKKSTLNELGPIYEDIEIFEAQK